MSVFTEPSPLGWRSRYEGFPPLSAPEIMAASRVTDSGEFTARRAAELATELKANEIVVLDLRGVTDMTDFFVIASGTSDTHVRAIAEHVQAGLRTAGVSTNMTEGLAQGRWALLDYHDCVVHVFHPAMRQHYQLERLWGDATTVQLGAAIGGAR